MFNHRKPYQVWSWPAKVDNSHIRVDPGIVPFEKSEKAILERYVSNTNGQYEKCLTKVAADEEAAAQRQRNAEENKRKALNDLERELFDDEDDDEE